MGVGLLWLGMHIPDGFLSLPVTALTYVLAVALVFLALRQTEQAYADKLVPLMGVSAAFIFAAQMINFPVLGGTSGHLLGGTLAGILLGPWAGTLAMVVVFIVQTLLFQDGGLTALGANILNMGLLGTFIGYYLYRTVRFTLGDQHWWVMALATGFASWCSVMLAAVAVALQLSWSGTVVLGVVLPAMLVVHSLIGIGEAVLTVAVVSFLWRTRPDLLFDPPPFTKKELT
ncbi:energy-coupling factor ABC transporter permease [Candidatus Cyanaurora vandensis]|uniref:energy-coupling factor ABC transporter permease n=1 Tax=Candidatus Cyanaurora vandensis TaxID=2714958 RepID=UPI00257D3567|nr:energy-coupling factor ABC transporter permease [Candidatus Cyanaurora vandensis]